MKKYTEHNRHTLRDALKQLPQYDPPEQSWRQIAAKLDKEEREATLKDALGRLPSYSPPSKVWEAIEGGLKQTEKARPHRFRLHRLFLPAAAAGIAVLTAWFLLRPTGEQGMKTTYAFEVIRANTALLENDWDEDEKAMQAVVEQFRGDPFAQRQEQYSRLLEEWRELEEARAEVKAIMKLYGKDARLIRQVGEIERERSRLARAMAMAI